MNWTPGSILELETERFVLRSMRPKDVNDDYVSWWNDAEVQKGLNALPRNWNKQNALNHIQQFDDRYRFHLGVFCKEESLLIGFFAIFIKPATKIAKTNVVIGNKDYWGQRVVEEIRPSVLDLLFDEMEVEKVKGEIMGRNYPSIFNYKAIGFRNEGILKDELLDINGGRTDLFIFGLLKSEWLENRSAVDSAPEGG